MGRGICWALNAEDIRHGREELLTRRVLSLDHMLEHTLAVAPDRAREGRRVRGARHRALALRRVVANTDRRGSVLIGECTSDIRVHVHRNAI